MNTSEKINLAKGGRELYQLIRAFHENDYVIRSNIAFNDVNIKLKETNKAFLLEVDLKDIGLENIKIKYEENNIIVEIQHIEDVKACGIGFESKKKSIMDIKRKFYVGNINEACIESICDTNKLLMIYVPKQ